MRYRHCFWILRLTIRKFVHGSVLNRHLSGDANHQTEYAGTESNRPLDFPNNFCPTNCKNVMKTKCNAPKETMTKAQNTTKPAADKTSTPTKGSGCGCGTGKKK